MVALVILLSSGCNNAGKINDSIPLNTQDRVIQERLLVKLNEKSIDYEIVSETSIMVSKEDASQVLIHVNQISNSIIPFHRSAAMAQPFRDRLIRLLEDNEIEFEEVYVFGQHWIIWPENNSGQVKELVEKAIRIDGEMGR